MSAVKPRGERVGWTRAEVSTRTLQRFKALIQDKLNKILSSDPLPEDYDLVGVTLLYKRGDKYSFDDFHVVADFNEAEHPPALSVFRLEGVKR